MPKGQKQITIENKELKTNVPIKESFVSGSLFEMHLICQ